MALTPTGFVDLPAHTAGGFDHGDVRWASGQVYVAHTATGSVEVIDGERLGHVATIPGCPEASGILCVQDDGIVFAAARGAGRVLVIEVASNAVQREVVVGPKPNGLAWDRVRRQLLVADVEDLQARLVDPATGRLLATSSLPGRPRWCVYDRLGDRFLVNIREPARIVVLQAATLEALPSIVVAVAGPHGLDLDELTGRIFVACDGGAVVVLDRVTGQEQARVPIAGEPDAIWYNAQRRRLYVAIGNPGVVDVVDGETLRVNEQVVTEAGAHTTAFDPVRQRLYVFLPRRCAAAVYGET